MHEGLGLGGAGVENGTGAGKDLQDVGVGGSDFGRPRYETGVEGKAGHADVLFHRNGDAVERADWFSVCGIVTV